RAGPELPARGGVAIGRLGSDRTALCTKPAPLPREGRTTWLAEIHRHEELLVLALDEERRGLPGLRHVRAQVLGRLERVAVDRQQHVARLDAGAARRARGLLDHEAGLAVELRALFLRGDANRDAEASGRRAALVVVRRELLGLRLRGADRERLRRAAAPHLDLHL